MVLKAVAIKIVYTFIQCIHISCFFLIKNHKHGTKINVLGAYHKEYMKEKKKTQMLQNAAFKAKVMPLFSVGL